MFQRSFSFIMYLKPNPMAALCIECKKGIDEIVYKYSLKNFGVPLCRYHQDRIRNSEATAEAKNLYFALRKKGIPAELQKSDRYKTIDIAIPKFKLNIEVDGSHHNHNAQQALSDLQRDYYSYSKGFLTLRIPNSLVRHYLAKTVTYIKGFLKIRE